MHARFIAGSGWVWQRRFWRRSGWRRRAMPTTGAQGRPALQRPARRDYRCGGEFRGPRRRPAGHQQLPARQGPRSARQRPKAGSASRPSGPAPGPCRRRPTMSTSTCKATSASPSAPTCCGRPWRWSKSSRPGTHPGDRQSRRAVERRPGGGRRAGQVAGPDRRADHRPGEQQGVLVGDAAGPGLR